MQDFVNQDGFKDALHRASLDSNHSAPLPDAGLDFTDMVKDCDGMPLRLFHGTSGEFKNFEDRLTFFSADLKVAQGYAHRAGLGGKVVHVNLALKNPIILDFLAPNTQRWYANKRRVWLNKGYDGAIIGGNVYVAFHSSQIFIIDPK